MLGMRLLKLGKHCKFHLMREHTHAFYIFDTRLCLIKEVKNSTKITLDVIRALAAIAKNKDRVQ